VVVPSWRTASTVSDAFLKYQVDGNAVGEAALLDEDEEGMVNEDDQVEEEEDKGAVKAVDMAQS
jgi:hypothetical protein